ncbi:MAG: NADP-dependent malic enzyme [Alphaproteobacteria bacterium]|nr:NADP-dependent malic enzyme [Alphaproteobacteria bacterium]
MPKTKNTLDAEALAFHKQGRPGKLEVTPTKPLTSQHDLSLAYSPGVAAPCLEIAEDPDKAYDYTAKSNTVAVISNGTAVLGLGDIGALASKPVMEGKAVLFKKFADIDGIDLEVDTNDVDRFVDAVSLLGASFGGINLEDIKSPECFIIEQRLRELMDIPVFHDDQHGTAIIAAAGLINAVELTGRSMKELKIVSNGAGAASIACVELIKALGVPHQNIIMVDREGVIYQGRESGMNQWKSAHAVVTKARSLEDALKGADVFLGLSVAGVVTKEMVRSMADKPIIFAMANPVPEIMPDEAKAASPDAIIATGRSDFPNQVNNVLGFPYIFRGALDVRASSITEGMKLAAAHAIANLAREDVPDEVNAAYEGKVLHYGNDYIIPAPFDPRLIVEVSAAVAQAAMDDGVARKPIADMESYRRSLTARLDPTASTLQKIFDRIQGKKRRVVFAEGEEERVIRAAVAFRAAGYGEPIMVAREHRLQEAIERIGLEGADDLICVNAKISDQNEAYIDRLFDKLQRKGALRRDCQRMVNQDRNIFAAAMVEAGDADAMVTGTTRSFKSSFDHITRVIGPKENTPFMASSLVISRGTTVFIGDTSIHERPNATLLADIAEGLAKQARAFGHTPRVAICAFSNFGNPWMKTAEAAHGAVEVLDQREVDFEYDGEMSAEVALDYELMKSNYPFCRLSGPANVLVMPGLHSANIAFKLLKKLGGGSTIGPVVLGASQPFQIVQMGASVNDIIQAAAISTFESLQK